VTEVLSRRTSVGVAVDDVRVVLRLGDRVVSLDYDTANRLAVLLRGHARVAKRNAGDISTKVIGFANLTDAVLDELKAQRRRDGTAVFTPRG
jgi:hypothetical protein